jgi:hypothetical protein
LVRPLLRGRGRHSAASHVMVCLRFNRSHFQQNNQQNNPCNGAFHW